MTTNTTKPGTQRLSQRAGGPHPWRLAPSDQWRRTAAHKLSTYSCQWCGKSVRGPAAFYRHLDATHRR